MVESLPPIELRALVLGLLQGLTEFLPISSAAHLILVPRLLGWPDQGLAVDIAANTGTLLAVLVYFRRDLATLVLAGWRGRRSFFEVAAVPETPDDAAGVDAARLGPWLVLGTLPVAIGGLLLADWVATEGREPLLIAWTTLVFGVVLLVADRRAVTPGRGLATLRWRDALWIGAAQALALVPGVSRSGITITAGLFAGLSRAAAARASFLLAIPVGLLVAAKDGLDLMRGELPPGGLLPLAIVTVVSALAGYAVIAFLLRFLRDRSLLVFVAYRLALAAVLFVLF
jgi:undecaprenyl-diphosphatase